MASDGRLPPGPVATSKRGKVLRRNCRIEQGLRKPTFRHDARDRRWKADVRLELLAEHAGPLRALLRPADPYRRKWNAGRSFLQYQPQQAPNRTGSWS